MKRGVLFDLDGTLVDHRAAADAAVAEWVTQHGGRRESGDDALAAEWVRLEALHFAAYLRGEATFQEQRRSRIAQFLAFLGRPVPDTGAVDRLFESYLELYEAAWVAYDDVVPALDLLAESGVALGVLTNGDEAQQRAKLRAVGLLDRFDCVVASSSLPAAKPDAAAFAGACERLGISPGSVSYVGDTLRTDALAATQAGLRGVWLNRLAEDPHVQPEATISSLLEIEAILG
ncbi:HAD family hydrolase [Nocardioides ochotonae]|uniref:HAD family hydrolase n=1 Tax=Nocardioides ochotonae TaxID=2685869 RepID=UPI00140D335C|nr:HAD family hydrolase [Nocardioides ochotonae]